ncbi:MAG: chromosomal replication initiator protein DnaA [Clostridiaceae bacterium]|nr:chromosomal replication initiator protein DnaA [Clostridiaceae bacterium]
MVNSGIDANAIWQAVCQKTLSKEVDPLNYRTWFLNVKPYIASDRVFGLAVQNKLAQDFLKPYSNLIEDALRDHTRVHYKTEITVSPNGEVPFLEQTIERVPIENGGLSLNGNGTNSFQMGVFNPNYTFDTFIVGSGNRFAHAASVAVASMKSPRNYNPLFLYGGSGLGKTHLLHAIGNKVRQNYPDKRVIYVQTEQFVNDFIVCVQKNEFEEFRNHYRMADMLLIDDIQFIESKDRMQVEFFYTFNALYESGKNVVLTCDKPPQSLSSLVERLRTRFMCGLTIDITPPDFETRVAILLNLCKTHGVDISPDIIQYIATNVTTNVREIEGAFKTISALQIMNVDVTLDIARQALQNIIQPGAVKEIDIPLIMEIVANYYNVTINDLKSKQRSQNIVEPRQISMYLCRKKLNKTLKEIGSAFGGRNHATVLHAYDRISEELKTNTNLQEAVANIEARLQ